MRRLLVELPARTLARTRNTRTRTRTLALALARSLARSHSRSLARTHARARRAPRTRARGWLLPKIGAHLECVDRELEEAKNDAAQPPPVLVDEKSQESAKNGRGGESNGEERSCRLLIGSIEGVHMCPLQPVGEHSEEIHP